MLNPRVIYDGSDGEATKALYAELQTRGPAGLVAVNLFRAQKCSSRAKVYRGGIRGKGRYRDMAYERKQWSIDQVCDILLEHGERLGMTWGWRQDPQQSFHRWVLYVELPLVGQVSFHAERRGRGPDYPGDWDGQRDVCADRIVRHAEAVLTMMDAEPAPAPLTPSLSPESRPQAPPEPSRDTLVSAATVGETLDLFTP